MRNEVSDIGLGCWGMSHAYGTKDTHASIETIKQAIRAGINLLDTADIYGAGENEKLVGKAMLGQRKSYFVSTKFGFIGDEKERLRINGRPDYVKKACDASLRRLNTDYIDLYFLHRKDPNVPINETVGAMNDLVKEGKIRYIGLSEVGKESIMSANQEAKISAIQSEYSIFSRHAEKEILPLCQKHGISFMAFSPLGRGILTKGFSPTEINNDDYRQNLPRFNKHNIQQNLHIVKKLEGIALKYDSTVSQLAIAYLLHKWNHVIPIIGMTKKKYLEENRKSIKLELPPDIINNMEEIASHVSGERHNSSNLSFIEE